MSAGRRALAGTKIVTELPKKVREIEHMIVPMPDGCRLAARVWMPEDAEHEPVPAILEYIPYRKNDMTAKRDIPSHPYVAGHGYAVVRLDLRGSGDSEGVLLGEYLEQELQDGFDAIQWIAEQDWCDGNVGMIGISWGGFNGLQVAALQPPALKAVVTLCSTDDRYADDVHYMGGALLTDNLAWASVMFSENTLPPDPRHNPESWRDTWHARLRGSGLWFKEWLSHQRRDAFWKHGSVCEDYSKIQVPVYAISGWADGYCNSVFRLVEHLSGPRKGLVGPWAHLYPHYGAPGPAIGFLQECLRWWDRWLKGRETGIMDEPMLRLYMQDSAPPRSSYAEREGRWIAEPSWPSPNIERTAFGLGVDGGLSRGGAGEKGSLTHRSLYTVGHAAGKWCSYAAPGDLPADQRFEDAASLCFETEPLEEALEMAGDAELNLLFSVDKPVAALAMRLVDVGPDGAATRVTYGVFNLNHRNGHETPEPLTPGEQYRVRIPMKVVAQRFEAGHSIRLALSTSYFPITWPSPEPYTLTVHCGESALVLPLRQPSQADEGLPAFPAPEMASPQERERIADPQTFVRTTLDHVARKVTTEFAGGDGVFRILDNDLTIEGQVLEHFSVGLDDPSDALGEITIDAALSRGDWRISSKTVTRLTSDRENFYIWARLQAWEGDSLAHEQEWRESVPRDFV